MGLHVGPWCHLSDGLKAAVKIGHIIESALIGDLGDGKIAFTEQLAGMADADLGEELTEGLAGTTFEVATESRWLHIG